MATYSEKKKASNRKWDSANLDRISIAIPHGQKDVIKAAAEAQGESMNVYIYAAVVQRMEREQAHAGGGSGISAPTEISKQ